MDPIQQLRSTFINLVPYKYSRTSLSRPLLLPVTFFLRSCGKFFIKFHYIDHSLHGQLILMVKRSSIPKRFHRLSVHGTDRTNPSHLWLIYIVGFGYRFLFRLGLQTKWLHCIMYSCLHCMESDTLSNPNCQVPEWDQNRDQNRNPDLWM